ncbi:hypothetical protein ACX1NX_00530 [Acinetobacter sp. ANC 5383]
MDSVLKLPLIALISIFNDESLDHHVKDIRAKQVLNWLHEYGRLVLDKEKLTQISHYLSIHYLSKDVIQAILLYMTQIKQEGPLKLDENVGLLDDDFFETLFDSILIDRLYYYLYGLRAIALSHTISHEAYILGHQIYDPEIEKIQLCLTERGHVFRYDPRDTEKLNPIILKNDTQATIFINRFDAERAMQEIFTIYRENIF